MLYDHQNDARIIFDVCYQLVLITTFVAKLLNEVLNHDKVSLKTILSSLCLSMITLVRSRFRYVLNYFRNNVTMVRFNVYMRLWTIIGIYLRVNRNFEFLKIILTYHENLQYFIRVSTLCCKIYVYL